MNPDWFGLAIQAAWKAGRRILELYATDFEVEHKTDHSPVTIADRQAHTIIRSVLAPTQLPLLSEEGRHTPYDKRKTWPQFWMVDPLDGTKEFIKRNGEFTVNIACIERTAPVAGVVYAPVPDRLYFAQKNLGAFKLDEAHATLTEMAPLAPLQPDQLAKASHRLPKQARPAVFTVAGSRSHSSPEMEDHLARLRAAKKGLEFISAGSSLKFCLVAEGTADQYPRLGPTMEWDTAAGQAVAEAAGARVLQFETRQPLQYNKASLLNPWFIVERG